MIGKMWLPSSLFHEECRSEVNIIFKATRWNILVLVYHLYGDAVYFIWDILFVTLWYGKLWGHPLHFNETKSSRADCGLLPGWSLECDTSVLPQTSKYPWQARQELTLATFLESGYKTWSRIILTHLLSAWITPSKFWV